MGTINNIVNMGPVTNNYGSGNSAKSCSNQSDQPGHVSSDRLKDVVAVDLWVRPAVTGECWQRTTDLPNGSPAVIQYEVEYQNTSNVLQHDVEIRFQLANGIRMVPHSTYLVNEGTPDGKAIASTDAVSSNGILIGSYYPHANAYIIIYAYTASPADLSCGANLFRTTVYAQPNGTNFSTNTADVTVANSFCGH